MEMDKMEVKVEEVVAQEELGIMGLEDLVVDLTVQVEMERNGRLLMVQAAVVGAMVVLVGYTVAGMEVLRLLLLLAV